MKHARVIYEGREHSGTAHEFNGQPDAAVRLEDGRRSRPRRARAPSSRSA